MRKNYLILTLLCLCTVTLSAQTLEEAKLLFKKGQFEKAKSTFKRYAKNNPNSGTYNHWYGVCCYETGEKIGSEPHLLIGAKKKVQESFRYLGQLYFDQLRFDEAIENYELYIQLLAKSKSPVEPYEKIVEKIKNSSRMYKGVEEVTIIDSIIVNKKDFLSTYKISEESGRIVTAEDFFKTNSEGTVYETELGNKLYYSSKEGSKDLNIYSKTKLMDEWGKAVMLPDEINKSSNANYPYVLSDGVTIYYASDGDGSLGGYDIFVTRYNTNTDTYLTPENVGMPFNSTANDYMYVIDEYNNLGWFATDRNQAKDKVCIYTFIPNSTKKTYNFENSEPSFIHRMASIHSIKDTWINKDAVKAAKQRLTIAQYAQPKEMKVKDFDFVIDDFTSYHTFDEFTAPQAKVLFKQWEQQVKDYQQLTDKLNSLRDNYLTAQKETKNNMAAGILDLEKRTEQMEQNIQLMEMNVRNEEKKVLQK